MSHKPSLGAMAGAKTRRLAALLSGCALIVSVLGAAAIARAETGAQPKAGSAPAPRSSFVFRPHAAPRPLPDLAFEDGQGRKRTLAEFRGKLVLLNVWATWCLSCREEMPALDRLQQRLAGPGFEVVALSIDRGGAFAVQSFFEEIDVRKLAIYVDTTGKATGKLGIVGIPTTLLIDRTGREIGRVVGPAQWDSPEVVKVIERYLAPEPKP